MNINEEKQNLSNKLTKGVLLKIIIVAIIVIAVLWLIFNVKDYGKVNLIISNVEITLDNQESVVKFGKNDKIYFYIDRYLKSTLDCSTVALVIYFYENNSYSQYKQITFEVDKKFKNLSAYIPQAYFSREGKYQLKVLLDGKLVATQEFDVEK